MRSWYKVVSASLVLLALFVPSLSLALCAPVAAASADSMSCAPDCPMMANMHAQQNGNDVSANEPPPCCTISSSHQAPITESFVVPPSLVITPPLAIAEFSQPVIPQTVDEVETSAPPIAGAQALLCTFLI